MLFMKNALLAILIVTPLFGLLSTMIVNNRMAFFSDALGHGAFTGIVIGALAGLVEPLWASLLFSTCFAVVVSLVKHKSRMSNDTVIGAFSSISVALGIFLATFGGRGFAKMNRYLIGDLLSITPDEILVIGLVLLAVLVLWVFLLNRLVALSIDSSLAGSRGVDVLGTDMLFTAVIAVVVTLSMSWVGLLVINAMLVLPASIARNTTANLRAYTGVSLAVAVFAGIMGLIVSYEVGSVAGATIVLILGILFLLTFLRPMRD
jgi:zinc transport system permease protein